MADKNITITASNVDEIFRKAKVALERAKPNDFFDMNVWANIPTPFGYISIADGKVVSGSNEAIDWFLAEAKKINKQST